LITCVPVALVVVGELLVFEPYPEDEYQRTVAFARKWGLDGEIRETRYEHLIASP